MESHDNFGLIRRRLDDDVGSNYSYGSGDDDPILTATITFDVTVDPNGQVISTSEGQIISEGIQRNSDGRTLNLLELNPLPISQIRSNRPTTSAMQADSLTSLTSANKSKEVTVGQDSLDDESDNDDSASTSTDSLMERTKKYMSQEAGIIILKKTNPTPKNFNINLDFDVENSDSQVNTQNKNFNINLDFENSNSQHKNPSETAQAWVDIDLMITSSATNSKIDDKLSSETFEEIKNALKNRMATDTEYWRSLNRNQSNHRQLDASLIENDVTRESLDRSNSNRREDYEGYHYINNNNMSGRDRQMESNSNIENDRARFELIDRLVNKATSKSTTSDKDAFYRNQLPKVGNFNLEDCIERALQENKQYSQANQGDVPALRTFETLDFNALTKGFEPEEVKEGKLVLYITENQLLQLLKQRAIVVPNKSSLNENSKRNYSLVDENLGSRLNGHKGPNQVELIVNQDKSKFSDSLDSRKDQKTSQIYSTNEDLSNQPTRSQNSSNTENFSKQQIRSQNSSNTENFSKQQIRSQNSSNTEEFSNQPVRSQNSSNKEDFSKQQMRTQNNSTTEDLSNASYANRPSKKISETIILEDKFEKYFPKTEQSKSILYEETFEHIRTVSQASNRDNFVQIKPGSMSATDGYLNKFTQGKYSTAEHLIPTFTEDAYRSTTTQLAGTNLSNGLQGSVYVGENLNNQSSVINDVLVTASKISNDQTPYSTISPNLNNFKTTSLTNLNTEYFNINRQLNDLEDQTLNELDKFTNLITNSIKEDRIDWSKVNDGYKTVDDLNKADTVKAYLTSLIDEQKNKSEKSENTDNLNKLNTFIDRAINHKQDLARTYEKESATDCLNLLKSLVDEVKNIVKTKTVVSEQFKTGHKIIIKTTRRLPSRIVSQSATNVANCNNRSLGKKGGKKRVSYSVLDNNSKTRVYELGTGKSINQNLDQSNDVFNTKHTVDYSVQAFDPLVDPEIGKPSVERINKYLSVFNTGVKNTDLIQIHPLLNSKTEINKTTSSKATPVPVVSEPVIIDSNNYLEEVSKHFGGLKVTDFPLYVQGLEIKQSKSSSKNGLQKSESKSKQTVTNSKFQYAKVNSATSATQSTAIRAQ
ncbi:unnamed protein product [Brachionus calyciflorus]|uniref:Uncharacterized protein n=1 Tax=Brachionus calyciflorus TaxID=104777 RepID=A0A813RTC8_9BILA|nr:unnamed protein product [Brachionus calyciflorus]